MNTLGQINEGGDSNDKSDKIAHLRRAISSGMEGDAMKERPL